MAGRKSAIDAVDELLRMPDEMKEEQGLDDDVKALKAAWLNETFAPEILEYKKNLVDDLLEIVAHQVRCQKAPAIYLALARACSLHHCEW